MEGQIKASRAKIEKLNKETKPNNKEIGKINQQISRLEGKVKKIDTKISKIDKNKKWGNESKADTKTDKPPEAKKSELEQNKTNKPDNPKNISLLNEQKNVLKSKIKELKIKEAKLKSNLKWRKERGSSQWRKELAETRKEISSWEKQISKLEGQIKVARKNKTETETKADNSSKIDKNKLKQNKINEVNKQEINSLKTENKKLSEQIDALNKKPGNRNNSRELQNKIQKNKKQIKKLEKWIKKSDWWKAVKSKENTTVLPEAQRIKLFDKIMAATWANRWQITQQVSVMQSMNPANQANFLSKIGNKKVIAPLATLAWISAIPSGIAAQEAQPVPVAAPVIIQTNEQIRAGKLNTLKEDFESKNLKTLFPQNSEIFKLKESKYRQNWDIWDNKLLPIINPDNKITIKDEEIEGFTTIIQEKINTMQGNNLLKVDADWKFWKETLTALKEIIFWEKQEIKKKVVKYKNNRTELTQEEQKKWEDVNLDSGYDYDIPTKVDRSKESKEQQQENTQINTAIKDAEINRRSSSLAKSWINKIWEHNSKNIILYSREKTDPINPWLEFVVELDKSGFIDTNIIVDFKEGDTEKEKRNKVKEAIAELKK